jgi:hypothetical protein
MRKILLSAAAAASLLATPVLAQTVSNLPFGSDEPQSQIQWDNLVAQANAHRLGLERAAPAQAQGDTAAVKGATATDAAHGAPAQVTPRLGAFGGKYKTMQDYWEDR